jgi:protein-serine/threonine kinase
MQLLGSGSFGRVVRVRHKQTRAQYAMKIIDRHHQHTDNAALDELNVLSALNAAQCPDIVRLHDSFHRSEHHYSFLLLELVRAGDLQQLCKARGFGTRRSFPLSEAFVRHVGAELVVALEAMHALHVVYRDLKPDNVMLDETGHVRLTDLGCAVQLTNGRRALKKLGMKYWRAPEMLCGAEYRPKGAAALGYGKSVDVWNLGLLLYYLLSGGELPYSQNKLERGKKGAGKKGVMRPLAADSKCSSVCADFLAKLLVFDPNKRLGCKATATTSESKGSGSGGDNVDVQEETLCYVTTDWAAIRAHPFFDALDWAAVREKKQAAVASGTELPVIALPDPSEDVHLTAETPKYTDVDHVLLEFDKKDPQRRVSIALGMGF